MHKLIDDINANLADLRALDRRNHSIIYDYDALCRTLRGAAELGETSASTYRRRLALGLDPDGNPPQSERSRQVEIDAKRAARRMGLVR